MTSPWQILAGNLAVVTLIVFGWGHARYWLRGVSGILRSALFGATMGVGAIASMLMAAEIDPGLYIDLRLALLAVSGFFAGPLAAIIALIPSVAWRMGMSGAGLGPGVVLMVLATLIGLAGRFLTDRKGPRVLHIIGLSGAVTLLVTGVVLVLPRHSMMASFAAYVLPTAVLNMTATMLTGLVVLQARRLASERDLMTAAMNMAPDYAYVKDRQGHFVMANRAMAQLHGFGRPQDMIGKTEFDIATPERAAVLYHNEQAIFATGQAQIGLEEHLPDAQGRLHWFTTSKIPLFSPNGEMVGLAGVTRDITEDKQMRQELIESRNMLSFALSEMSDGLAMFDSSGRIEFCNDQYRAAFPYTGTLRQPGAHMRDILHAVIESGEQITAPIQDVDPWIERIAGNLNQHSEEEVNLFDGRWLQVRTRPTSEGRTLVVVTDITRMKMTELALHSATDQLKTLVRTDALTGLFNRRAFDDSMDTEIARSARTGTPMSLLLIDVDRFKNYNDEYGHLSGDDCLRLVAQHLQKSLKRPADLACRYGGEEFAAILPDTDEDGAYLVAESFRRSLVETRVPHRGSERGVLTASVGVATYMPDNLRRSSSELIQAADEALYSAKAAGRDRVFGTRVSQRHARFAHE